MKHYYYRIAPAFLVLCFSLIMVASASAQTFSEDFQDGKIYLKFKDTESITYTVDQENNVAVSSVPVISRLASEYNITGLSRPFYINNDGKLLRTLMLEISDYQLIEQVIDKLKKDPALEYVEKVPLERVSYLPNDSLYGLYNGPQNWNWHLELIQAELAWNITKGNPEVVVGIVDNAVWVDHPDLAGKIVAQRDVIYGVNNANPPGTGNPGEWSHGTHVAGLVGGASDNNIGVASIGFNVNLIAVKAANNLSPSSISGGYQGIQWAANNGADIINMSWGGSGFSQTNQNIINSISAMGVVLIAAAGNDNVSAPHYPSAFQNVISVASIDYNDAKSDFSNYSTTVDISSPGGVASPGPSGVLSTTYSSGSMGNFDSYIGTSMASPVVAGVAALVLSMNPDLTPAEVENILESTCDDISVQNPTYNGMLGAGRVNAFTAVSSTPFEPTAAFTTPVTILTPATAIDFESLATGVPSSWTWTFQGGSPSTSSAVNPENIAYNAPGSYDVTLSVTNQFGTSTLTLPDYIQVTPSPSPYVFISISDSVPCIAETITLSDSSLYEPTSWAWTIEPTSYEFVNGTSATSENPQVSFLMQGYYHVTLAATNQNGTASRVFTNAVNVNGIAPPYTLDLEDGSSGYFILWDTIKSQTAVDFRAANNSLKGIHFHGDPIPTGWKGHPTTGTPEQVWTENPTFMSEAYLCGVDARNFTNVKLAFDLRQTFSLGDKYSWFRVLINGVPVADYAGRINFNPLTAGADPWQRVEYDLTPFAGQIFDVTLQACNRFSNKVQGEGDNVLIDNIEIVNSVSVNAPKSNEGISVFPNPATDRINIKLDGITQNSVAEIVNTRGKVVYRAMLQEGTTLHEIATNNMVPGLYLVRVMKNGTQILSAKVVLTER